MEGSNDLDLWIEGSPVGLSPELLWLDRNSRLMVLELKWIPEYAFAIRKLTHTVKPTHAVSDKFCVIF